MQQSQPMVFVGDTDLVPFAFVHITQMQDIPRLVACFANTAERKFRPAPGAGPAAVLHVKLCAGLSSLANIRGLALNGGVAIGI